jgi:hypothetical protein
MPGKRRRRHIRSTISNAPIKTCNRACHYKELSTHFANKAAPAQVWRPCSFSCTLRYRPAHQSCCRSSRGRSLVWSALYLSFCSGRTRFDDLHCACAGRNQLRANHLRLRICSLCLPATCRGRQFSSVSTPTSTRSRSRDVLRILRSRMRNISNFAIAY